MFFCLVVNHTWVGRGVMTRVHDGDTYINQCGTVDHRKFKGDLELIALLL